VGGYDVLGVPMRKIGRGTLRKKKMFKKIGIKPKL